MIEVNSNFDKLKENYLFTDIARRVKSSGVKNPILLGVGDIKLPLRKSVKKAYVKAAKEQGNKNKFKGYPPTLGYDFLKEALSLHYLKNGARVCPEEIFVSDGAKSDVCSLIDLFSQFTALVQNPSYPPYVDDNIIKGNKIEFVAAKKDNSFLPLPIGLKGDCYLIYLCSPANPTGAVYGYDQLKKWVDFALNTGSVIIFDGAYSEYVSENYPKTIFAVEGAEYCAIEINSFSKWASFTGMRCGWTAISSKLKIGNKSLKDVFIRRQSACFNGVNYCVQRAAEAALSEKGYLECMKTVKYYLENARLIKNAVINKGLTCFGGDNSPYLWLQCPFNMTSMEFFDFLLNEYSLVGTPGSGFGTAGEGYFRLTGFNFRNEILKAVKIIDEMTL